MNAQDPLEVLRESEARLRALAEGGQALIWTAGLDMKCDWFNQVWLNFTGRAMEEEVGDGWTTGVHPDDYDRCVNTYVNAFRHRKAFSMDYRLRHHEGEYRWIQDDGHPRYGPGGEFIGYVGHCLDITRRKHAELMNHLHWQVLQMVMERAPLARILGIITDGIEVLLSERRALIQPFHDGRSPAIMDFIPEKVRNSLGHADEIAQRRLIVAEIAIEQNWAWPSSHHSGFLVRAFWWEPIRNRQSTVLGHIMICRDTPGIPDPQEINTLAMFCNLACLAIEQSLQQQRLALIETAFQAAGDAIFITDANGLILDTNPAFTLLTGHTRDTVLGKPPSLLQSRHQEQPSQAPDPWETLWNEGGWQGELWHQHRNGSIFATRTTLRSVPDEDGQTRHFVGVLSDVTERKALLARLEYSASHDLLTGLPNRALLQDRLHQAMAQADRHDQKMALVFMDLDGFKHVNDQFGHAAGDELLVHMGECLSSCLRLGDTLARVGGDEFVAVLVNVKSDRDVETVLKRMLEAVRRQPAFIPGAPVSLSMGVTFFPQPTPADARMLMAQADQAMYLAKQKGKNRYCLHAFRRHTP
ncbi:hypothetical protein CKO35_12475 [Ectothiorhodospira shaposhnikovii]|uniref:sensor domain-containing diguanylate cyclase n=1 Tax=Ectothiorhodospira shaposhnikovii TaxID=1054 RepID=UPI0019056F3B|nr:sensor domain-containing diguanylate cyclase [Ectothiorhodospira shaposhnikovii]MBK1674103.1 hypothetical protein [Ectothiorhodospira shaposhnikovii]